MDIELLGYYMLGLETKYVQQNKRQVLSSDHPLVSHIQKPPLLIWELLSLAFFKLIIEQNFVYWWEVNVFERVSNSSRVLNPKEIMFN